MWDGVDDRVTDTVFRMEESDEDSQESVWADRRDDARVGPDPAIAGRQGMHRAAIAGQTGRGKKTEPIRNRGQKVGRNDPCPCGSGKKYKNCHMRQTA